jgi:tRNA dimethylallyltransferase
LVGATATGKSAVALEVARTLGPGAVEIVSVDSMQVYRGMDIGTAKPSPAERAEVPHHLIDIVDPTDDFSVARFQRVLAGALDTIDDHRAQALLVGGTGLYARAAIDGLAIPGQWPDVRAELEADGDTAALHERLEQLDPIAASRMEPTNRRRIVRALEVTIGSGTPFSSLGPGLDAYNRDHATTCVVIGLTVARDALTNRIRMRLHRMVDQGFVDEVRALVDANGDNLSRTARQAIGYRELIDHVVDGTPLDTAIDAAIQRTRRFAVRQERWFRRDPRIEWIDTTDGTGAAESKLLERLDESRATQ